MKTADEIASLVEQITNSRRGSTKFFDTQYRSLNKSASTTTGSAYT